MAGNSWHPDLGTEVGFLCRNRPETKTPIAPTIGVFYLSAPALPYQSLRFAPAMMTTITPVRVQKTSFLGDRLQFSGLSPAGS
jgi:hypothetical protein